MDIHALLRAPIDMAALARFLDERDHADRVAAVLTLNAAEQAALYDAARGFLAITVDDVVPPALEPLRPVVHWGRNSLAAFRYFQKVMCRPAVAAPPERAEVWGYNAHAFGAMTGPGYFVAYGIADGEVLVDYTRLPPHGAPSWPRVIPNSSRLSRWVYNQTQDTLRGVSRHVTIGRAARGGAILNNWFVLCREDPAPA